MPVVYRVAKQRHPIYDTGGAMLVGGRWTSPGAAVIYTAEHYATAILEILVHRGRVSIPGPHRGMTILVPDDLTIERFDVATHHGWDIEASRVAREYGDDWYLSGRTAALAVPSVAGQPVEWNVIINPAHRDAARIKPLETFDVPWDGRLFLPATASRR